MYESFYKLTGKAFRLSPDPGFFFPSRGHKRALAYLRYGVTQAEGFVVITGAPGTGKTTLAQILARELGREIVVAHITTTQLHADDMLRMVVASFGLRYESQDKAVMLKALESFLMARAREGKRVLLVVDEAQNVPHNSLEELRMLSNMQVGNQALVQTFLLGQPQFRQMLDSVELEQLRQRVIANYHLSALAADEIGGYIESRLSQVGWKRDPIFTADAYATIHAHTQGIPRRMNVLCDRIMLYGSLEEIHKINADVVNRVIAELDQEISGKVIEPELNDSISPDDLDVPDDVLDEEYPKGSSDDGVPPSGTSWSMLDSDDEPVISASSKTRHADEPHTLRFDEPGKDGELPEDGIRETVSSSQLSEGDYPRITTAIDDPLSDMSDSIPYIGDREIRREFGFSEQVTPAEEPVQESAVDELVASGSSSAKGHERVAPAVYTSITTEKERFRVIDGGRQSAEPARSMSVSLDQGAELRHGRRDAINRKILRFVLAYHRAPRNFPALGDVRNPLPEGISNLLELAAMEDAELQGNRLLSGVGVSSEMFRAAVRFYVRRVFLVKGGDHYRVLGLAEGAGQSDVERHYDSLMKLFRREQQPGTVDCVETIGQAYETLAVQFHGGQVSERRSVAPTGEPEAGKNEPAKKDKDDGRFAFSVTPVVARPEVEPPSFIARNKQLLRLIIPGLILIALCLMAYAYISSGGIDGFFEPQGKPADDNSVSSSSIDQAPVLAATDESPVAEEAESATVAPAVSPAGNKLPDQIAVEKIEAKPEVATRPAKAAAEKTTRKETSSEMEIKLAAMQANAAAEARSIAEAQERALAEAKAQAERDAKAKAQREAQARTETAAAQAGGLAKTGNPPSQSAPVQVAMAESGNARVDSGAGLTSSSQVSSIRVSESELDGLLRQFTSAYQSGNLDSMMNLFDSTARTEKQLNADGIRQEYQDFFSTTRLRSINLSRVAWSVEQGFAHGTGDFTLSYVTRGEIVPTQISGTVTIQAEKSDDRITITRFYQARE